MSSDIETRILEMKLDNDQFEKGVKSTIQSLEELEEKLELKDAADGFDKVSKAANTMQFSSMERSLDAITDKFSLLGNVGLQALERISNKIVDIGENIIKGITIDPVMDGWREFEMKTNSIQTIFGGIRNQYANSPLGRSKAFSDIGRELDELNQYADQTIYSFAQMTENVGKFTNQSIGLETATDAIKGVGNWAAMVGADTAQMSRAMYNISQALGGGSMKLIDWRSIKYANMSTPDVQKLFADIAYAQGGMLDKNGKAYKKGSKQAQQTYKAIIADFEGNLKSGWLTNEVMMNGLKVLSGELKGEELVKLFGDTAEAKKLAAYYEDLGAYAAEAATQVKTLTQLIGVFQEALGSGWATTFDKLFGGFQKQTEFFTKIANLVGYFIDRDTTNRNNWVDKFTKANEGTELVTTAILNIIGVFTEFWGLIQDVTQKLISPFNGKYWFNDPATVAIFGGIEKNLNDTGMTAQHVAGIISDLNMAFGLFYAWFHGEKTDDNGNVIEKATPAYQNAMKIFAGLGSVVMIALNAIENLFRFGGRILALFEPLASSILNMFGNVGEILYSIYQNIAGQHTFSDFFDELYKAVGPTISAIVNFISTILDLIASLFDLGTDLDEFDATARNNKLGPFIKTLSDIFEKFPVILKPALGFITLIFNKMTGFISGITKGFPAIKKHVKKEGVTPFEDLKDIVQEFIAAGFGEETAKTITDWYNNNVKGTFASLVDWFGKAYDSITTFFQELPGKVTKLVERVKAAFNAFQNYNYNDALSPYQNFKDRMQEVIYALFGKEVGDKIVKTFKENIEPKLLEVAGAIESAFAEVRRVLNGLAKVFTSDYTDTENPFDILQAIALNFLEGYDEGSVDPNAATRKSSVLEFFKNLEESYEKDIKPVVDKVTGWVTKDIPRAFDTISRYLFGSNELELINEGSGDTYYETKHIGGLFDNILAWINGEGKAKLEEIVNFFSSTWTSITDAIFGYDTETGSPEKRAKRMASGGKITHVDGLVDIVLNNVKNAYEKITGWISGEGNALWQTATDFFFGEVDPETKKRSGGAIQAIVDWYNEHSAEIEEIFTVKIPVLFGQVRTALFGGQQSVLVGENKDGPIYELQHVDSIFKPVEDWINGDGKVVFEEITGFFENAWEQLNHVLFGYDDAIDPEGTAVEHIPGLFENLKKWAEDDGAKIWNEVMDFMLGKTVTDKEGNVTREGGAFQAIQTFLDPIIDWIKEKGSWLYEYVTNHSFSEMWAKLGELFAGHEVLDKEGNSHLEGGYFSELLNILRPISNFFEQLGTKLFNKVTSIDYGAVWQSIHEFFFGYEDTSELVWHSYGIGKGAYEPKHVDGLFDKLNHLLDRINAFFESDTWQSIKGTFESVYNQYIKPTFDFLGGGFGTLFTFDPNKGFFENILTNLHSLGSYATTEFPNLISSYFPNGFNIGDKLGSIIDWLGGLIPPEWSEAINNFFGGKETEQAAGKTAGYLKNGLPAGLLLASNGTLSDVGFLKASSSVQAQQLDAAKQDMQETKNTTENASKGFLEQGNILLYMWERGKEAISGILGKLFESLGGLFSSILDNAGPIAMLALGGYGLSQVSEITQSLTGHQKDRLIQDIADLFEALGGFIQSIAWLVAAVTGSELLSSLSASKGTNDESVEKMDKIEDRISVLDKIFDRLTSFLNTIFLWLAGTGVSSFMIEGLGETAIDAVGDHLHLAIGTDTTSISENIRAFGEGFKAIADALGTILTDLLGVMAMDQFLKLLPESMFTEGEKGKRDGDRLLILFDRAKLIIQELFKVVKSLLDDQFFKSMGMSGWNSILSGLIYAGTYKATGGSSGIKYRGDSYAASIMAVGSLIESIAGALGSVLTVLSFTTMFTDAEKLQQKVAIISGISGAISNVVSVIADLIGALNTFQAIDAISGLKFDFLQTGGIEGVTSMKKGLKFIEAFGWTTAILAVVLATVALAAVIADAFVEKAAATIYKAVAQINGVIETLGSLGEGKVQNAEKAAGIVGGLFADILGNWKGLSNGTLDQAKYLRNALTDAGLGLNAISKGLESYQAGSATKAIEELIDIADLLKEDSSIDFQSFQGQTSFMALAGQNVRTMIDAFSEITADDVSQMETVKLYFLAFQEISQILSAISALGNFGAAMDFGIDMIPFMDFIRNIDAFGGTEGLKSAFETIIEALPDSPELLTKLSAFSEAGGGDLGMFTTGLIGLTGALDKYLKVIQTFGTNESVVTNATDQLAKLDQLGHLMNDNTDYAFLSNKDVAHANTRLGQFAHDLGALADSFSNLMKAGDKVDGTRYDLKPIEDFLVKVNSLGRLQILEGRQTGEVIESKLSTFATEFQLISQGFEGFASVLSNQSFNPETLDLAAHFIERVAGAIAKLAPNIVTLGQLYEQYSIDKSDTEMLQVVDSWSGNAVDALNGLGVSLPVLGQGLRDLYLNIKDDFPAQNSEGASILDKAISVIGEFVSQAVTLDSVTNAKYNFKNLGTDLWNDRGDGLFQRLGQAFTGIKEFNVDGMNNAERILGFVGSFAGNLAQFMAAWPNLSFLDDPASSLMTIMSNFLEEGLYPSLTTMPITELQSYAAAFSDLSNALAMNGQTATLVTAIDQAIEALKDKEIQITVTPVWKDGSLAGDLNAPSMTMTPNVTNTYSAATIQNITFPDVQAVRLVPEDMSALTGATRDAATTVAGRVDIMSNTIGGLRVQLDTGVLVGYLVPTLNRRFGRDMSPRGPIIVRDTSGREDPTSYVP